MRKLSFCPLTVKGSEGRCRPLKAADGSLLSDQESVVSRWTKHFCNLLNRPLHDSPDVLVAEAEAAIPDADIDTHPPLSRRLTGL